MSDASTRYMMARYSDEAPVPRFLTSLFTRQFYFDTEEVELDVERDTEDVAIVIQDLSTGTRKNETGKFTNKSFKPPLYNEEFTVTAFDLTKRVPGQNPFENPDYAANALSRVFEGSRKLHNKVARAIELQAAQVLTTGELILTDDAGIALFSLDYQPKSTHFVTPTAWAATGLTGNPLADLEALAGVLRRDGRQSPVKAIFGGGAATRFRANADVKANLNSLGMQQLIQLRKPERREDGATFLGYVSVGVYPIEMWTYDAVYKHPQTGVITPFIPDNKVILVPDNADMRIAFGSIPRIVPPDPRVAGFIPDSLRGPGYGLSSYAWITADGLHLKVSVGSRPLVIPAAIDSFGAITAY